MGFNLEDKIRWEELAPSLQEKFKNLQNLIKEATEEAYKQGAEDVIRRFAFVYETVAQTAKADAYAEAGAVNIEEITQEEFDTIA